MNRNFDLLADLADAEFDGESYNGKSLFATLGSLGAAEAAADSSFEGYSAWSVALHVAYCKWLVAKTLLDEAGAAELGPYPYPVGEGGFAPPPDQGKAAWTAFLSWLLKVHRITMRAIRGSAEAVYDKILPEWGIPVGKAAIWLCSHDSYHTAQIRSMGVPGIKGKRIY